MSFLIWLLIAGYLFVGVVTTLVTLVDCNRALNRNSATVPWSDYRDAIKGGWLWPYYIPKLIILGAILSVKTLLLIFRNKS